MARRLLFVCLFFTAVNMKKFYMAPGEFHLTSSMSNNDAQTKIFEEWCENEDFFFFFFGHNSNAEKKLCKNAGAIKETCCFSSISEIKSFQWGLYLVEPSSFPLGAEGSMWGLMWVIALADCSPNNLINQAQLLRRVFCHFLCGDFFYFYFYF